MKTIAHPSDLTPAVTAIPRPSVAPRRTASRDVLDLLLAGDDDTLPERLALLAVDAIEERETLAALLSAALGQLAAVTHQNARLCERLRAAQAAAGRAA